MVERRRKFEPKLPAPPSEYNSIPIAARLLVGDEDIEYLSVTNVTMALKKDLFNEFQKGLYIDLMFIGDENKSSKVYRYKMITETETAINLRLECEL